MSKHTPGPWVVDQYGDVQANAEDVALVPGYYGEEMNEANARLIAAAPDLLAALSNVADWLSRPDERALSDSEVAAIHAAIAKATGKQP